VAGIERSAAMVLLNDFQRQWAEIGQEVLAAVGRVGASGWYILGEYLKSFEDQLARSWPACEGVGMVGMGSGLDTLEIGLRCLRVGPADPDAFVEHLRLCGIQTAVHYPHLIPAQRALVDYGRFEVAGKLNNARRFAAGEVSLPIHPFLTEEEISRVIASCNAWKPS
jgi:dTDP-4-amino-4,6-dideoxygalactose transaminase